MNPFLVYLIVLPAVMAVILGAIMALSPAFFEFVVEEVKDLGSMFGDASRWMWFYPGRLVAAHLYEPAHGPVIPWWRTWSG